MIIQAEVQNTVQVKIGGYRHLVVAYSGGIDSSVLLHTLAILRQQVLPDLQLKAIYIHHGISHNADSWAQHCQQQCQHWQIPCIVERVTLVTEKGNIEAQARQARYQAIAKHLSARAVLCTAQHLDDQCETFFLALKRGSGPMGLAAMKDDTPFGDSRLLRPLLTISRQKIEQYAAAYRIKWVEDESNQDDHYDRNFLRLNILPQLNQRWPHFSQMVIRSAALCGEQQQLLDELLATSFKQLLDQSLSFAIEPLLSASSSKRNGLLRMWFKRHQMTMPSRQQLELIWQTVALAKADSNPQFLLNGKQIRRYQNRLYLLSQYQNLQATCLEWDIKKLLVLPDNLGQLSALICADNNCRLPKSDEQVSVRFLAKGQLNIVGRHGSRPIKKLWQELNVPPWRRSRIPLIYYNETLITAVGLFVTEQGKGNQVLYQITPNTH